VAAAARLVALEFLTGAVPEDARTYQKHDYAAHNQCAHRRTRICIL